MKHGQPHPLNLEHSLKHIEPHVFHPFVKDPKSAHTFQNLKSSLLHQATTKLLDKYLTCNPRFNYSQYLNPKRLLTKPVDLINQFDNKNGDLVLRVNDVIASQGAKYNVLDLLGQGTFGQVVKCRRDDTKELVAIKIVKNRPAYFNQGKLETKILSKLNQEFDPEDKHHIVRIRESFTFKGHLCLVFELLSLNLFELIKQNQYRGLPTVLIRAFLNQILDALTILSSANVLHCDLKPENILLSNLSSPHIKLIDFGSACFESRTVYTYIQSRFYRSPEVIVGYPYTGAIDVWSLGCISAELYLGLPLFPGNSEYNQLSRILEMRGSLPEKLLEKGKTSNKFFDRLHHHDNGSHYRFKTEDQWCRENNKELPPPKKYFKYRTLEELVMNYPMKKGLSQQQTEAETNHRCAFADLLHGLLCLDPDLRWTPEQAISHPFLSGKPFLAPFVPDPSRARSPRIPLNTGVLSAPVPVPGVHYGQMPYRQNGPTSPSSSPSSPQWSSFRQPPQFVGNGPMSGALPLSQSHAAPAQLQPPSVSTGTGGGGGGGQGQPSFGLSLGSSPSTGSSFMQAFGQAQFQGQAQGQGPAPPPRNIGRNNSVNVNMSMNHIPLNHAQIPPQSSLAKGTISKPKWSSPPFASGSAFQPLGQLQSQGLGLAPGPIGSEIGHGQGVSSKAKSHSSSPSPESDGPTGPGPGPRPRSPNEMDPALWDPTYSDDDLLLDVASATPISAHLSSHQNFGKTFPTTTSGSTLGPVGSQIPKQSYQSQGHNQAVPLQYPQNYTIPNQNQNQNSYSYSSSPSSHPQQNYWQGGSSYHHNYNNSFNMNSYQNNNLEYDSEVDLDPSSFASLGTTPSSSKPSPAVARAFLRRSSSNIHTHHPQVNSGGLPNPNNSWASTSFGKQSYPTYSEVANGVFGPFSWEGEFPLQNMPLAVSENVSAPQLPPSHSLSRSQSSSHSSWGSRGNPPRAYPKKNHHNKLQKE